MNLILITILVYSLILTIVTFYKDNSSYFSVELIDVMVAGPVMWVIVLFGRIVFKLFPKKKKNVKAKIPTDKQIERDCKKIIQQYKIKKQKTTYNPYFDLLRRTNYDNTSDWEGWDYLLRKKAMNEHLNDRFANYMYNYKDKVIPILSKYFVKVTEEILRNDDCNEWYIEKFKDAGLYKIV